MRDHCPQRAAALTFTSQKANRLTGQGFTKDITVSGFACPKIGKSRDR